MRDGISTSSLLSCRVYAVQKFTCMHDSYIVSGLRYLVHCLTVCAEVVTMLVTQHCQLTTPVHCVGNQSINQSKTLIEEM